MENNIIANINNKESSMFISFTPKSIEDKKLLYEATTNGTSLKEVLNKPIKMMDVIVSEAEVKNEKDGTTATVPRISIITVEGEIYTASSWGVYNCLSRINGIFGTLHFDDGLTIVPVQVKTKNGFTINLRVE